MQDLLKNIQLIDQKIILKVQDWRRPLLNKFFIFLTALGTGKAWSIYALVANVLNFAGIQFVEKQNLVLKSMLFPLLAFIIGSVLKKYFSRKRPSVTIEKLKVLVALPNCGSFPSSHTSSWVAFALALCFMSHPIAIYISILAILIAVSRLYLGVHFLSDIIGGGILGLIIVLPFK